MARIESPYWTVGVLSPQIVRIAQQYNLNVTHYESYADDRSGYRFHDRERFSVVTIKELMPLFENDDYAGITRLVHRACQNVTDEMGSLYVLGDEAKFASSGRRE